MGPIAKKVNLTVKSTKPDAPYTTKNGGKCQKGIFKLAEEERFI